MHGKLTRAAVALSMTALGTSFVPAASKTTSTLAPGSPDDVALRKARLLASHGEPGLALSTLLGHEFERGSPATELTASLLAELGRPASAESLLTTAAPASGVAEEQFRHEVVRARLLLDARRYPAALDAIAKIDTVTASPYLAYRDLVAARALKADRQFARALTCLERSLARAPEAIRGEMDALRVDLYRSLGRPKEALAAAIEAAGDGGDAAANRKLLAIRFDLAREAGDHAIANDAARDLFRSHRRSSEARACAEELALRDAGPLDTELLLACASVLHSGGRRESCRSVLRRLDTRELSDAQSEELRLLWGEYHYMNGDYSRAIALARPSYADPALRRRSMLLMARSYKRVGRTADAATTYRAYARVFPNDGLAAEALYTAASLYGQLERDSDRERVLDQLRHAYPSTFHGWAAAMARAKALDAAGAHEDAAAIFDQWLARSRRTDEAALFYSSRQRKNAGDESGSSALAAELRAVNPYSFYARPDLLDPGHHDRAAAAAGRSMHAWLAGAAEKRNEAFERVRSRVASKEQARPASEVALAIERGRFFLSAGLRDWAECELEVARRRSTDAGESLALARLFDDHAMPWRSVRLYERTRAGIPWRERKESADDFRYLTHPVPYPVQVMSAAQREKIAPYILYGMMREESCFDTDVVSRAGAVGLMQLMPETARSVARRLDLAPGAGERLGDPVVNVSIGSWYAADLLRSGDGSAVWMLAAYNAGPAAASRWIEPGAGGDDAIDAVDSIDYKETRGYVKRVVESANVYHTLYFDGSVPTTSPR